ncbi:MAG: hypothetical protein JW709_04995 [Sedimentisphaerales bacterium]|nr:hypothetical protein [Sedimentisphaerales bacterium]
MVRTNKKAFREVLYPKGFNVYMDINLLGRTSGNTVNAAAIALGMEFNHTPDRNRKNGRRSQ